MQGRPTLQPSPRFLTPPTRPHTPYLVLAGTVQNLLVADLVHELETLQGLLHADADVLLVQGAGAVRVVEEKQALGVVQPAENEAGPRSPLAL